MMNDDLKRRIANIRLLALDSDGVLTDGGVYVLEDGTEFRRFDIKDGLGLKRVMEAGIEVAIISASSSQAIVHRAQCLGIHRVYVGVDDKRQVLLRLCQELEIGPEQVAYVGDDLTDLPVLSEVGLPCAPADAIGAVKEAVLLITSQPGGHGAVREVCDSLLAPRSPDTT